MGSVTYGSPYAFTSGSNLSFDDGLDPIDDHIDISVGSSSITIKIFANDATWYWSPDGGDVILSFSGLSWTGGPSGSYIDGITASVTGALAASVAINGTSGFSVNIPGAGPGDDSVDCADCGTITIDISHYEPVAIQTSNNQSSNNREPSAIPAPGALALFGLGLAGLGLSRRRKDA